MPPPAKKRPIGKSKAAIAENKRLDKVEKTHGGKNTGGVDTVIVRKAKVTRKKTDGGMKTIRTGRSDFIDGKTGKVERNRHHKSR
jgi:hypothetical protein